jgi:catechol 2,3-dioxygenase-like lactoylglutathione lyase family enzyme
MNKPELGKQITFLRVGDLAESAVFYEEALGLDLVLDQGGCRIYQAGQDAYLGICQAAGQRAADRSRGVIFTFVVEDVDGWHRYLVEQGLELEEEPQVSQEYQIYHFFIQDPDGYNLEFQRFLDPAWRSRETGG